MSLILIAANLAGLNCVILAFHTLRVNRRLPPPEQQSVRCREATVAVCGLSFGALLARIMSQPEQIVALFWR